MMNIRQVGNDLEVECVGCGEPLLLGSGDSVGVRIGISDEGPFPEGFLCFSCDKKENGENKSFAKVQRLHCSECGRDLQEDDRFRVLCDNNGDPIGMICESCDEGELWRE